MPEIDRYCIFSELLPSWKKDGRKREDVMETQMSLKLKCNAIYVENYLRTSERHREALENCHNSIVCNSLT